MERDQLDDIDFRQDAGPPIKKEEPVDMVTIIVGFDKILIVGRWIKERLKCLKK